MVLLAMPTSRMPLTVLDLGLLKEDLWLEVGVEVAEALVQGLCLGVGPP